MAKKSAVVKEFVSPIKSEFENRDIFQVIIGASVLAVPVGFTEETWALGQSLPLTSILAIMFITILFISAFTYSHYHKEKIKSNPRHHLKHLTRRVFFTYAFAFAIVGTLLAIIQVAPWTTDAMLAFKRTAIVAFPCSMSAAIADLLK